MTGSGDRRQATTEGPAKPLMIRAIAALVLLAAAVPVLAEERAIDGDTLEIEGERIRLRGIDAFELGQTCLGADGTPWRCGVAAKAAIAGQIDGAPVSCTVLDQDAQGHYLARCTTRDGTDLGAFLVASGLALPHGRYAQDYRDERRAAERRNEGAWGGIFMPPWRWRSQ